MLKVVFCIWCAEIIEASYKRERAAAKKSKKKRGSGCLFCVSQCVYVCCAVLRRTFRT